jgi:hypothetical protein
MAKTQEEKVRQDTSKNTENTFHNSGQTFYSENRENEILFISTISQYIFISK